MTHKVDHNPLMARIAQIDRQIEALNKERAEVEAAMKVLARYSLLGGESVSAVRQDVARLAPKTAKSARKGTPRPKDIPTIWEMTTDILAQAERRTLHIDTIVDRMAERWWPGLVKQQIAPSLYGFAKQGRLDRGEGTGVFTLPLKQNEPPEGGSDTGEGDASPKDVEQDRYGDLLDQHS